MILKNITFKIIVLSFISNILLAQNNSEFDSVSFRYVYNTILNHYLNGNEILSLAYSGMRYDLKTDYVEILKNNIKDQSKLAYYRRQFELDTFYLYKDIDGKFDPNTLVSQFKVKSIYQDENEIYKEMLKDTNCVVVIQFSDIYLYKDRFIVFAIFNNSFKSTIVKYEYMYEFHFCPISGLFEFLKWSLSIGFNFENGKVNYFSNSHNFPKTDILCDE